MDKYEYKLKTEQMLEFMEDKTYDKAAEIADTIDWRRVRNAAMLSSVSDIYDMNGDFQKSFNVLSIAYERASGGRKVVYRLGILALKLGDIDSALRYYEQFMQIAPKDPNQHILRYKILRAQRAPVEEQIDALEEFKKAEYIEKWAYELAKLYEEAGMTTECLDECDDLILWFSEGRYVYQAMELKMQYKPLTPSQQEKYDNRDPNIETKKPSYNKPEIAVAAAMASAKEVTSREVGSSGTTNASSLGDTTTLSRAIQSVVKKKVPTNAPTIRLPDVELEIKRREMIKQEELEAAKQQRIAEAKALEAVREAQAAKEAQEAEEAERALREKVQEDVQDTTDIKPEAEGTVDQPVVSEMKEEDDGQMSMEDVLSDWEKTSAEKKAAAEQSISAKVDEVPTILSDDIQRLIDEIEGITPETHETETVREPIAVPEEMVNKGNEAEDLRMENLPEVDEDIVEEVEDLPEDEYEEDFEEDEYEEEDFEEDEYEEEDLEEDEYEEEDLEEDEYEEEDLEEDEYEEEDLEEDEYEEEDLEEDEYEEEDLEEDEYEEEDLEEDEYEEEDLEEDEYEEEDLEEDEYEEEDLEEDEYEEEYEDDEYEDEYDEDDDDLDKLPEVDDREIPDPEDEFPDLLQRTTPLSRKETAKMIATGKTAPLPMDEISDALSMSDTGFIVHGRYDLETQSGIGTRAGLTDEQKKLFSYFVPVRGMSEQLVDVLEQDKNCTNRKGTSCTGNLLIIGRKGSGKTVLAVDVVKAIQKQRHIKQGKVAIVTGDSLNRKKVGDIIAKLRGGALIIEKAGKMNEKTVARLNKAMERDTGELLIVLEEQRKPLDRLLTSNREFRRKFTSRLEVPIFINDELVTFGQTYAKENGYRIDEMGILALYSRIDALQREDHAVTVAEVKEIMDEAQEHSQKASAKKLVKRVFGKSTDSTDRVILSEKDFNI